jgi:hypothetical protein
MPNEKEKIKNELNQLSPELSKLNKGELFEVSAYYFEGLQQRVLERIRIEAPAKTQQDIPAWLNKILWALNPQYSMALAMVIVVIVIAGVFNNDGNFSEKNISATGISTEAVSEYLLENEITTDIIANRLSDNDILELENQIAFYRPIETETINELLNNIDELKIMEEFL